MSNTLAPFGFDAVCSNLGVAYVPRLNYFPIISGYAANIFLKAPVIYARVAGALTGPSINNILTNTSPILGIATQFNIYTGIGVIPSPFNVYWASGTLAATGTTPMCGVECDPNVLFNVQYVSSSDSHGDLSALTANANSTVGTASGNFNSGNTANGQSTAGIDVISATNAGAANLPFKVVQLAPVPNNQFAVSNNFLYNYWYVKMNNAIFNGATTSTTSGT